MGSPYYDARYHIIVMHRDATLALLAISALSVDIGAFAV